jgi:hypothetical protein
MKRVILLQILLLAGVTAAATDPNLVGWWKLDEASGTTAFDSIGTNNGTVYGGATWTTNGKINGALSFDGTNDYVNCGSGPSNYDNVTVSVWMKTTTEGALVSNRDAGGTYGTWFTLFSTNIEIGDGDNSGGGYRHLYFNTNTTDNAWHHVVYTKDGINHTIYVDGAPDLSFTTYADISQISPLFIGLRWNRSNSPSWFNGTIDEVRIYNRALTADEVHQLYTGTVPVLTGLTISGPNEVAEDSTASYKAIAQYDDGTAKDVTALAEWQADPNTLVDIESGQLATGQALYPKQNIKVYADYTENLIDVNAQKQVSVMAICPQGNALMFDGVHDYVVVPDSTSLRFTQYSSFSICLWVKPVSGGYFLSKMQGTGQHNVFGYEANWDMVSNRFSFVIDQSGVMNTIVATPTGSALPDRWYHVAYLYQNKNIKIYLDGQLSATGVFTGNTGTTSPDKNLSLGIRSYDISMLDMPFGGILDEVHIYNRVLSANEIQTIMHLIPIGSDPNLVAYWDFDAGAGQTVADVSGHGNNGTLGSSTGIDAADPCWVESDAPVGKCTTEQVLGRNLLGATDDKKAANLLIADAKSKEQASITLIVDLQKQMKGKDSFNAFRARILVQTAIFQEDAASKQIDMTIKSLDSALLLLNYEVDSNDANLPWFWPYNWGKNPHFGNRR